MRQILSNLLSQPTKNRLHQLETRWSNFRNGNPSKKIFLIGVTGTKGKTTVCNMIASVLDSAGIKNAMETTICTKIGSDVKYHTQKDLWVTTPPAREINKFLQKAIKNSCKYAILEVTSQAIDQNRVHGLNFDLLIYTNLSHDHLDYHGNKEGYLNAKLKLFVDNPQAQFVINADDTNWARFFDLPAKEKLLYSVKKSIANGIVARKFLSADDGTTFTVAHNLGQTTINLRMPGVFNASNALSAFSVGLLQKIEPVVIKAGLENIAGVRGRMEVIRVNKKQDITVIVDYAHNPDSLKNVYETVKSTLNKTGGRLIAVLGATGRRDKIKRPIMGALAGRYADLVIFTNEDPYDEDPVAIIEDVARGIFRGGKKNQWRLNRNYWKVLDRAVGIHKAIKEARKNDVVLITGKGAEEVMAVGLHQFVPFSDRTVAKQELRQLFNKDR